MNYGHQPSVTDKMFGSTDISGRQAAMIKQTYLYLSLAVVGAIAGAIVGIEMGLWRMFTGIFGWIIAMVLLNVIPMIAMAARHNPVLGLMALIGDGFIAGLVISPMLYVATTMMGQSGAQAVIDACVITAIIFAAITGYVMTANRTFSAPRGLMMGIFAATIGVVFLNMFMGSGLLSLLVSAGIGLIGVLTLVYATSDVLNNPEADSPIPGALMLFSGLFNVFVAVFSILMSFAGDD